MKNFFQQKVSKKIISGVLAFAMIFQGAFFYGLDFAQADDTIAPVAQELRYFDSDKDGKVNTIEIKFNETITGSLVSSNFAIGSSTGGLADFNIPYTSSGRDLSKMGSIINGNILRISFSKFDKVGTGFTITNGTDSHLRVRTYTTNDGIGITDLAGNPISFGVADLVDHSFYGKFQFSYKELKIANNITGFNGYDFKIPVIVNNFQNIGGFETILNFPADQMTCSGITSDYLTNSGSLTINNSGSFVSIVWDLNNDSALNLDNGTKILDFNCTASGTVNNNYSLNLITSEVGDGSGSHLDFVPNSSSQFFNQENVEIRGVVKNIDGSIFTGAHLELKNNSISVNNIFQKISDAVGYVFSFLTKSDNYQIDVSVDQNYDENTVDIGDVIKIQRHIVGLEKFTNGYVCAAADVNIDNRISVLDVIKMRRYLVGLSELPAGNFKFFTNNFSCEDLASKIESVDLNNLSSTVEDVNFVKVRMGDVTGD